MNVFISHAQADRDLAGVAAKVLAGAGLDVWWGVQQLLPGENWAAVYASALQQSKAMVVLLTPQAVDSEVVLSEISFALGQKAFKGRLVPVYAEPHLVERFPWILKTIQGINLSDYARIEDAFEDAATQIKNAEYETS